MAQRDDGGTHEPWLTDERLRLYPGAVVAALVVAFVLAIVTADGASTATGRLGGDFPAFYGAGKLVLDGRILELYDWDAQRSAQVGLHPAGEEGRFLAFAYPPFFALAYAPFAALGYVPGYVAHSVVMAGLLALAVHWLRPVIPAVGRHPLAAFAGALVTEPLFRAVTGGQNTALTLVLVAAFWRAWHDRRDALAGVPLGLLLFKPQLGIPLIGLAALERRWGMVPSLLAVAAALWAVGAALGGVGWIGWWWGQIAQFHALDQDVNAASSVGVLGVAEALFGPGTTAALAVAGLVVPPLVALLMLLWVRKLPLDLRMAATACGLVLIPPHAMHYDSGLVVLAWWVIADVKGTAAPRWLVVPWLLASLGALRRVLGVDPAFGALVVTLAVVLAWTWQARPAAAARKSATAARD